MSSVHSRSPVKTPKTPKPLVRAQSTFGYDDMEMEESLKERDDRIRDQDDRIRELEEIIAKLQHQGVNNTGVNKFSRSFHSNRSKVS